MGPYGITQVDVPGLIQGYEASRQRRTQEMLLQRDIERQDREREREERRAAALAKLKLPGQGPAEGGDPVSAPGGAGAVSPAQPAATSSVAVNADVLRDLAAIDPDEAMELHKQLSEMDDATRKESREKNKALASLAYRLKRYPGIGERRAELERIAPQLEAMGIDPAMLTNANLDDNSLQGFIDVALDVDKLFDLDRIRYIAEPPGGRLVPFDAAGRPIGEGDRAAGVPAPEPAARGDLFGRVLEAEGGTDPQGRFLISPAGAVGPAQVMPGTAPEAAALAGVPFDERRYRSDPEYNKLLGKAYLDEQLRRFGGDEALAAAAYNAGPGRVREALQKGGPAGWLRHVPPETQDYVAKVMGIDDAPANNEATLRAAAADAIARGADPAAVNARLQQMLGGAR